VGAQKYFIQRVKNSSTEAWAHVLGPHGRRRPELADVVEDHDDHDQAAHHVEGLHAARGGAQLAGVEV